MFRKTQRAKETLNINKSAVRAQYESSQRSLPKTNVIYMNLLLNKKTII